MQIDYYKAYLSQRPRRNMEYTLEFGDQILRLRETLNPDRERLCIVLSGYPGAGFLVWWFDLKEEINQLFEVGRRISGSLGTLSSDGDGFSTPEYLLQRQSDE